MPKQVLSVGNCNYDCSTLREALQKHFDVEVHEADTSEAAELAVKNVPLDLVVVNRLFDLNQESGIALIKKLNEGQKKVPMMLISNFPEYQEEAQAAGAVPGFGKKNVGKPDMIELVAKYLK